ncbi:hypothetical protein EYF80_010241 [Liparis tanakae]|uniref:Uncharacterized protein n=1 Tax=Liparis tanakae TaxID=230148 RepID=A0A4Z2INR2_9TELE|nr:hypothetical protein EYF80_010241 [Liparis tanakae]
MDSPPTAVSTMRKTMRRVSQILPTKVEWLEISSSRRINGPPNRLPPGPSTSSLFAELKGRQKWVKSHRGICFDPPVELCRGRTQITNEIKQVPTSQ